MGQPVRKIIQETHPELSAKPFYTLLIDGNNLLKQSMIDSKVNSDGIHYGGIFQFLLQIRILLTMDYKYDYVYKYDEAKFSFPKNFDAYVEE